MCGADLERLVQRLDLAGSPPRVRSRRALRASRRSTAGITSACAEQTSTPTPTSTRHRDHLRVCGADGHLFNRRQLKGGSPPRVRSRQRAWRGRRGDLGITSACAEQTPAARSSYRAPWDHLRVCGADTGTMLARLSGLGSPPRVRSRHGHPARPRRDPGITSACAEQTR